MNNEALDEKYKTEFPLPATNNNYASVTHIGNWLEKQITEVYNAVLSINVTKSTISLTKLNVLENLAIPLQFKREIQAASHLEFYPCRSHTTIETDKILATGQAYTVNLVSPSNKKTKISYALLLSLVDAGIFSSIPPSESIKSLLQYVKEHTTVIFKQDSLKELISKIADKTTIGNTNCIWHPATATLSPSNFIKSVNEIYTEYNKSPNSQQKGVFEAVGFNNTGLKVHTKAIGETRHSSLQWYTMRLDRTCVSYFTETKFRKVDANSKLPWTTPHHWYQYINSPAIVTNKALKSLLTNASRNDLTTIEETYPQYIQNEQDFKKALTLLTDYFSYHPKSNNSSRFGINLNKLGSGRFTNSYGDYTNNLTMLLLTLNIMPVYKNNTFEKFIQIPTTPLDPTLITEMVYSKTMDDMANALNNFHSLGLMSLEQLNEAYNAYKLPKDKKQKNAVKISINALNLVNENQ